MKPMQECISVARKFGDFIASEDYQAAHALLTTETQANYSPEDFKKEVVEMTSYAPGPILKVVVLDETNEEWPDKQDSDVACVYVALTGARFNEAVYLTIARQGQAMRIREIQWGRP